MNKQKRQSTLRLIVQAISFAFHNGYLNGWIKGEIYTGSNKQFCVPGLNCYSCPGAIGACPIGSLQAVLDSGGYKFSCYVFGLIAAIGMLCGRFVCGWLCPFGLVQDLLYKIPFAKKTKNLPGHQYLKYLRFLILAVFVIALPLFYRNEAGAGHPWFCMYICPSGTLLGGIPLSISTESLRAEIGIRFIWKLFLLLLVIIGSIAYYRPFCKYVCPLGALYGLCNPVSIYRLKVDKQKCIGCGACQRACGMDIKVFETPNSMDCIRCGSCMATCPKGAITSTFTSWLTKEDPGDTSSHPLAESENKRKETVAENVSVSDAPNGTAVTEQPESDSTEEMSRPMQESSQTDTDRAAVEEAGLMKGPSSILVAACLDFLASAAMIYLCMKQPMGYILQGSITNKLQLFTGYLPNVVVLLPAVMLILLGVAMTEAYRDRREIPRVRELAVHSSAVLLISIVLIFIGSLITFYTMAKTFDGAFLNAVRMIKEVGLPLVLCAVANAASVCVCTVAEKKVEET